MGQKWNRVIYKLICITMICSKLIPTFSFNRIPPDVKEAALCRGVKNGTTETWNKVFELFQKTLSTSEREASLLALACSTNETILSG